MEAAYYDNIMEQQRLEPEFFRVGFYGRKFPFFLRVSYCDIYTLCLFIIIVKIKLRDWFFNPLNYIVCIYLYIFLSLLQNKEFVCRGHDYERLEAFQQRMLGEFPQAIAMQHPNQPDEGILLGEAQCILHHNKMVVGSFNGKGIRKWMF